MVNVNARLPFNLHNHASSSNPHPSSSSQSLSSSSRSLSHTDGRVPTGIAHSNSHIQVHVGAPLSALSSPVASTSRPPVFHQASPSRSSSMASRETGDGSVVRQREQPILGLKLVRIPFPENMESSGRRGRKKKKISEEASDGELASPSAKTPTAHDAHFDLDIPTGDAATPRPPRQVLAAAEISISPASTSSVDGGSEEDQVRRQKARKINEARTFAIRDDGPLSISWGDWGWVCRVTSIFHSQSHLSCVVTLYLPQAPPTPTLLAALLANSTYLWRYTSYPG